jgi:hypothetical protein
MNTDNFFETASASIETILFAGLERIIFSISNLSSWSFSFSMALGLLRVNMGFDDASIPRKGAFNNHLPGPCPGHGTEQAGQRFATSFSAALRVRLPPVPSPPGERRKPMKILTIINVVLTLIVLVHTRNFYIKKEPLPLLYVLFFALRAVSDTVNDLFRHW